jgi:hypothetical protein
MANENKVRTRDIPKYTSSSDEESDDDVDYSDLFKSLYRSKVDKINELIDTLNEKDILLEKQEDILYEEHDKLVNVEKSLALENRTAYALSLLPAQESSCHALSMVTPLWLETVIKSYTQDPYATDLITKLSLDASAVPPFCLTQRPTSV